MALLLLVSGITNSIISLLISTRTCKIFFKGIFSIKENLNIKVAIRKKLEELNLDKDVTIYDMDSYNKKMNEIWAGLNSKKSKQKKYNK